MRIDATVGTPLTLDAAGTRDPDGHTLTYRWFFYSEAGHRHPGTAGVCWPASCRSEAEALRARVAFRQDRRGTARAAAARDARRRRHVARDRHAAGRRHGAHHSGRRGRRQPDADVVSTRHPHNPGELTSAFVSEPNTSHAVSCRHLPRKGGWHLSGKVPATFCVTGRSRGYFGVPARPAALGSPVGGGAWSVAAAGRAVR